VNTLTVGTTFMAFGLFVVPVSEALELSRAEINTAIILLSLGMAITAPFVGRAIDRFPLKIIMVASTFLFGGSLVVLGLSDSVWLSAAIIALPLSIGMSGAGPLAVTTLVARWFTVRRGRALAIAAVGTAFGSVAVVPPLGIAIELVGWRAALAGMGAILIVLLLLMVGFVRDRPGPNDHETLARGQQASPISPPASTEMPMAVSELMRKADFWIIVISIALSLGVIQTIAVTLVPLAQGTGISTAAAAGLLSLYGVSNMAGKLLLAWVADRSNKVTLLICLFALVAIVNAMFLIAGDYYFLAVCSSLVGLTSGAISPGFAILMAERYGPASFGTANGLAAPVLTIIGAVCVRYAGEVYDRTGGYDLMFITFVAAQVAAAMLMIWVRLRAKAAVKPQGRAAI